MQTTEPNVYGLAPILTVQEAADFLGLNYKTVYAAIKDGAFPARKVRGRCIVFRDSLIGWLLGQGDAPKRRSK